MTDFKNLAQLSSDALLVVTGGCISYANPSAQTLMAPTVDGPGLQGLAVSALWAPNPLDTDWRGDDPLPCVTVHLNPGHPAHTGVALELTATRDHTPDGPVFYVKARRAREAGDRLAERVRTALALSTDAAMVVDAQTLQFLDANPAACALMGVTPQALRSLSPTHLRRRDGSGTEDFHALYAQLIAHSPQAQTHEYDFLAQDGRTVPIAATRQALNVEGHWLIFITWRDISAQVSAQALVQQFKDSFDQTPDATNIIDVQTLSYVYVNEPFIRLVGLPRERVLSGGPLSMPKDIVVVDDLAAFLASVVAHHPQSLVREKTVTLPDGQQATFESHHQAVLSGGRWLVRATRVDITQRKQQQRHLHRVMAAVDSAVDAIFIIDPVTMGYVEVNEAAALLFETPRQTLRTLRVPDLMPRLSAPFSSDELAAHYRALIHQAPQPMTNEIAVHQAGGRQVPVENVRRAVQVNGEWLIISVMRDISARKQAQLQLELLKAAFNAAPDAIMVFDPVTWEYVDVNEAAAQLYGVPREQMISAGIAGASRQDDATRDYLKQIYAKVVAQSPLPETDVRRLVRTDGYQPMIEATRRAMCVDGRWLIVSVNRDITQRLAAQAQLELLVAAVDSAPDAIAILDPETFQYVHVNEAVCRLHGLTREAVMASGMLGMFRQFTPESLRQRYDELIAMAPQAISEERTVRRPDGSEVVTEAVRRALRVGDRWLVISVSRDISDRKAAQERIERFAAIVNLSSDAVLVHDPQRMTLVDVNEAACRLYGYNREQLLALPPTLNRPDQTLDDMRRVYADTIAAAPKALRAEFITVRRDGSPFPAEAHRQAIPASDGWLVVVTVRDQTERLAAQARIERFAAIVNLSADALFVVDRETMHIVDVNDSATRMYGYPREALLGRPVFGVTATYRDAAERMAAEYDAVIAQSPQVSIVEMTPQRADGSTFHAEVQRMAILSEGRWLVVTTVRDISERKTAQARLELMSQAINAAPDAIVVIDPLTLEYVDVNEATAQMYGLTREQLLARGARGGLGGTGTDEEMKEFYARIVARSPNAVVEERGAHLNGHDMTLEFTRRAVNVDGRWLIVSVNRDITERKAAQARQELLTAAIEAAPDGIAVVDPVTLQYLHVNEAVCRTHAASREQLMALGVDGIFRDQLTPDAIRALYQTVIDSYPGATSQERAIIALDGSTTYYEAVRRAVQVDGRWLIVSMNRNVTERKAAQARMETLTEAFNVAPDPIVVVDPQTMRYVDVNEAAARLVGQSREDMLALGLRGVFAQDQAHDGLQDVYQEAVDAAPNIVTRERVVFDSQGNPRILEGTRRAARIDGRWLVVSVTRDITDRKRAQERAERFAAVVNLSADAVFVVDRATLRILDVNEAACRMYGRSREELLALPPSANRPGMDTADLEKLYDDTIARSPQVHHMEHEAIRADGTIFRAETHRLAIQSEGQWLILATVRDITERKRAESEIRQRVAELELLREAYDAAVDAILIADPETLGYYDVNHAAVKLLGVSREDLLTRGVEASYYSTAGEPFDAERFRRGSRYVISRAPEVLVEVRTVNPLGLGGRDTVIEFSRRGVNIDGRWVIVTLMRDITAAHRAEEEIRQRVAELTRSNQELEQFAYVTSHDLSEPLRMVASYTQLLSRRYADKFDDDGREFIKYAVDGAQRMKQLIDDLLMYSRAGRSKVPMRHIRLDRSLDDALANLANAIERNGATIERDPLPEVVCEKAGLTQVFQNLVGNAIKFRGEAAPVVRISAVQDEHFWTISVADNGIGISSEYFQRIFVIFQRLHARTKYEGTGIGLSICKKIVERHGGQITVASEPGQGTTFSFTLSRSLTESEPT